MLCAINAILNLSNSKNADVSDVMISKRKFDISLYVTLVSLNESECICFNSRWTKLSSQSTEREKISTFGGYFSLPGRIITSCETVLFPLLSIYPRAHLKRFDWGLVKERLLYEASIIWQKERLFPPEAKLVIREVLNRSVMLARRDSHVLLLCKTSQWKHKTQSWTRLKSDLSREVIKLFKVILGWVAIAYERCLHCIRVLSFDLCRAGELVLMDAGSEYHGYASDITRTWPVSGKFNDAQRQLYELVLRVHKKCIKVRFSCPDDGNHCFLHQNQMTNGRKGKISRGPYTIQ